MKMKEGWKQMAHFEILDQEANMRRTISQMMQTLQAAHMEKWEKLNKGPLFIFLCHS